MCEISTALRAELRVGLSGLYTEHTPREKTRSEPKTLASHCDRLGWVAPAIHSDELQSDRNPISKRGSCPDRDLDAGITAGAKGNGSGARQPGQLAIPNPASAQVHCRPSLESGSAAVSERHHDGTPARYAVGCEAG